MEEQNSFQLPTNLGSIDNTLADSATLPKSVDSLKFPDQKGDTRYSIYEPFDKYTNYIANLYPNTRSTWNQQAAQNQSGWNQAGHMLVQGIVGQVLVQGVIGGIGGLSELPRGIFQEMIGQDAKFSNFITKFADDINQKITDTNPIFEKDPNQHFAWTDFGWWMNNMTSVFSTLGLLIPAEAGVKGLSWISKGLKGAAELREAAAAAKIAEATGNVIEGTMIGANQMTMGSRILRGANQLIDTDQYWQRLIHESMMMRHAENLQEASQNFNTIHDEASSLFTDDKEYQRVLNSEIGKEFLNSGREQTKEGLATYIASKSSWKNYGMNAANLIFDMVQLAPLVKGFEKTTRNFTHVSADVLKAQAESVGTTASKTALTATRLTPYVHLLTEQVGEGAEEFVNAVSQSDSNWYGRMLLGTEPNKEFSERFKGYLKDQSTWEQAFWGFAGGVTFSGATRGIRGMREVIDNYKNPRDADQKILEIQGRVATTSMIASQMKNVMEGINPITNKKYEGSELEINTQKNDHLEMLSNSLADNLGKRAITVGNVDYLLDWLDSPATKKDLVDKGLAKEGTINETVEKIKQRILVSEKNYNKTYNSIYATTNNEGIRRLIAENSIYRQSEIDSYKQFADKQRATAFDLLISNPDVQKLKEEHPTLNIQGIIDNAVDSNVINNIQGIINEDNDSTVKSVLESQYKPIIDKISKQIKERTTDNLPDNKKLPTSLYKYIQHETTARIYDLLTGATKDKLSKETNPTTAAKEIENQISSTIKRTRSNNFKSFRTKLNDETKITSEDTNDTITEKINKLENYKKDIIENKIDPNVKENDPTRTLETEHIKEYSALLDSKIKILQSKLLSNKAKENRDIEIEQNNKLLIKQINDLFSKTKNKPTIVFTGKRNQQLQKMLQEEPANETGATTVSTIQSALSGESPNATKAAIELINDNSHPGAFDSIYNILKNKTQPLHEHFINEILIALGYEVVDKVSKPNNTLLSNLEQLNKLSSNENTNIEVVDHPSKFTFDTILETPVGSYQIKNFDNIIKTFDTLTEAQNAIYERNNIKPVNFTSENRITREDIDLANKIMTELTHDKDGNSLIQEYNKDGSLKKVVSIKYSNIIAEFLSRVSEADAIKWYSTVEKAFGLVKGVVDSRFKLTDDRKAKERPSKTDSKYQEKTFEYINKIYTEHNLQNIPNIYTFNDSKILNKTGGEDALNIWLFTLKELGINRDEEGNVIGTPDQIEALETILNLSKNDFKVRLRIDTSLKGSQSFKLNKENPNKVPIIIQAESVKEKGKFVTIGALGTLPMVHNGVPYNFEGNDWTDIILSPYKDSTTNTSISNFRLKQISNLWSQLREYYMFTRNAKHDKVAAKEMLSKIQENDHYDILSELLDGKSITDDASYNSLRHILKVLFFGDNTTGTPASFNHAEVSKRISNWKDKLYRDYLNSIRIRDKIKNDPTLVIETKVIHQSPGNIVKSLDKDNKPIYHGVDTLGSNPKLYKVQKSGSGIVLENVKDAKDQLQRANPYEHTIFVGIEVNTIRGKEIIPVPLQRDTLNGSISNEGKTTEQIDHVFDLIRSYSDSKRYLKGLVDKGDDSRTETEHISQKAIESRLSDFVYINTPTSVDEGSLNNYGIQSDRSRLYFLNIDKNGNKSIVFYNLFTGKAYEKIIGASNYNAKEITDEEFKQKLGQLKRNVNYNSFNGKFDFNGKTYKTYQDYLIQSKSILTDVGWVKDQNGNNISNVASNMEYNNGGMPLIVNIDSNNTRRISKNIDTFDDFRSTFDLDKRFDFAFGLFSTLLADGKTKFGGVINEEMFSKGEDGKEDKTKPIYVFVDKNNILYVTKNWVNYSKTASKETSSLLIVHDILHTVVGTLSEEQQTKFRSDLTTLRNTVLESKQFKDIQAKETKTDNDLKILDILNNMDIEEFLTYGLTDIQVAEFLDSIESDVETKESVWTKFKTAIRQLFEALGLKSSKLDELNNVLNTYFETVKAKETEIETAENLTLSDLGLTGEDADLIKEYTRDFNQTNEDIKAVSYVSDGQDNVDYEFRSINIIQNNLIKLNSLLTKGIKFNTDLYWKKVQELGVPSEQLELLKQSEGNTIEEKLLDFTSKYGFKVESKITKTKPYKIREHDNLTEFEYNALDILDEEELGIPFTERTIYGNANTQHYIKLTQPGGINYTENELSTPLITPSIKGHAQFSTDNGIGWFRSDEQTIGRKQIITKDDLDFDNDGRPIETKGEVKTIKQGATTKTRRILEVQSDLFQKGRDRKDLLTKVNNSNYSTEGRLNKSDIIQAEEELRKVENGEHSSRIWGDTPNGWRAVFENNDIMNVTKEQAIQYTKDLINKSKNEVVDFKIINKSENQFLQLLNKDSNWVTFFIKSIIQDSAKKGYEKVLFPKGETAAKIEGHETIANRIITIDKQIEDLEEGLTFLGDGELKDKRFREARDKDRTKLKELQTERTNLKSQGIEKLKPIEAFYEIRVTNILKKLGNIQEVTDEYDNKWNEVTLSDKDREGFKFVQYTSENKYNSNDVVNEEVKQGFRESITTKRKLFIKNEINSKKLTILVKEYNSKNNEFIAKVSDISGTIGTKTSFIAITLSNKETILPLTFDQLIEQGQIKYVDEETGKPCAKFGLTNTVSGTNWKVVKDFDGMPKHEQGGVNITIESKGVHINRGDSKIHAKHGLVIEKSKVDSTPPKVEEPKIEIPPIEKRNKDIDYIIPTKLRNTKVKVTINNKELTLKASDAQRILRNKIKNINSILNTSSNG